jgi:hypothetical protein
MQRARKLAIATLVAFSIALMLVFAYLGLHTRPMSDDFCYILTSPKMPFLEFIGFWRNTNDGSFTDYALRDLLGPLGFEVSMLFPAILIGVWFLITALLVRKCLTLLAVERQRLALTVSLAALIVAAICSGLYGQNALYWYAASVRYSVSVVALTLFMWLLLQVDCQPRGRGRFKLLAAAGGALCFASAGFSETVSISQLIILTGLSGALLLARGPCWQRRLAVSGLGWLATVASMLVIVTAPGLMHRIEWERAESPSLLQHSAGQLLTQTGKTWFDRISDPAILASFMLLLAAGLFVSLTLGKPAAADGKTSFQLRRNPLLFGLVAQLLLLPFVWLHQSDDAIVLGRFSAAYFVVIVSNIALVCGLTFALWQRARLNAILRARDLILPSLALAFILLIFALTQFRSIHLHAHSYLWISCISLLLVLTWLLACRLSKTKVRVFAIAMGSLVLANWTAIAAVAFVGHYFTPIDTARTFTFAAHLAVWQGLAWGVFLGCAIGLGHAAPAGSSRWWLRVVVLVAVLALGARIAADQLTLLPKFQLYAKEYDVRHASIIQQRAEGRRRIIIPPLTFNLERYLEVARLQSTSCSLQFYDVDAFVVQQP